MGNKDSLNLVSCGYPYGGKPVCYRLSNLEKYVDMIGASGQMYRANRVWTELLG